MNPRSRKTRGRQTSPATSGFVAWLDLSSKDIDEALRLLAPGDEDTVDELGLGVLAENVSERLYPATNVTMKYARYYLFVAAIYRHLETLNIPSAQVRAHRRTLENKLRDALESGGETDFHGSRARDKLRRYPSNIYWGGMRDLGLYLHDESDGDYIERLDQWHESRRGLLNDDRKRIRDETVGLNWDPRIPRLPLEPFPRRLRFKLKRAEADYLRNRILERHPESLLAYCLSHVATSPRVWPWNCGASGKLAVIVTHARALSAFARGATLLYFHMLLEKRGQKDELPAIETALSRWYRLGAGALRRWRIEAFPIDLRSDERWATDEKFLRGWRARCLEAGSARRLLRDDAARSLVVERDSARKRSRFRDRQLLKSWDADAAFREARRKHPYRFSYRHAIGQRIVSDILAGGG